VESRTQVPVVFIDDLPFVTISPLRATRAVLPTDQFAWVHVGGEDFKLRLHQRELMHGVRFTISCVRLGASEKRENFGYLGPGSWHVVGAATLLEFATGSSICRHLAALNIARRGCARC
jgi:hypothetical protein